MSATKTDFMEQIVENQKQVIDKMTDAAKKLANNNKEFTQTVDKTSDFYKTWMENQAKFMNEQNARMQEMAAGKLNAKDVNDNVKNWMDDQMKMTNDYMEFSKSMMNNYMESVSKMMPTLNGSGEKVKNMLNENFSMMNQWNEMMKKNYEQMTKSFDKSQLKDVVDGMYNSTEMFNKFVQLWEPVVKGFQNQTLNADNWMNMMNPSKFQEMMGSMFGQSNDFVSNMSKMYNMGSSFNNMGNMFGMGNNPMQDMFSKFTGMFGTQNPMQDMMNKFSGMFGNQNPMQDMMSNFTKMYNTQMPNMNWADMMNNFKNMNNMFANNSQNPWADMMNNTDMFGTMMKNYNDAYTTAQDAFGPMSKMMTPNANKKDMDAMAELMHLNNQYNIKNAEMMYMNYTTGMKAMQKIGEMMQEKFAKNEPFKGMTALYQEWLNTSDKVFVALFETDEYSKVQGEVAALSHKLKHATAVMMEKAMENLPVVTRTEMDELYKAFYDLRKNVYNAGKEAKAEAPKAKPAAAKATAKPAAAKVTAKPTAKAATKKTGRK